MVNHWPHNRHFELPPYPYPMDNISAPDVGDFIWIFSMGRNGNDSVFSICGTIRLKARTKCRHIRHYILPRTTGRLHDGDNSLEGTAFEGD